MDTNLNRCTVCQCDIRRDAGRCTNRCCSSCHANFCTGGGNTTPGHGLDVKAARSRLRAYARGEPAKARVIQPTNGS
jgi:hypothetical protein